MLNYQKLKHIKTWKKSCHQTWLAGKFFIDWLVVWNMNFMTFHILGMSSFQLTNSYFSEGVGWNHQPDWYSMIFPTSFWVFLDKNDETGPGRWFWRSRNLPVFSISKTGVEEELGRPLPRKDGRLKMEPLKKWGDDRLEALDGWVCLSCFFM